MFWLVIKIYSTTNIKLIGQVLSSMINKIGDVVIDFATDIIIVKKFWSRLITQYYEKG